MKGMAVVSQKESSASVASGLLDAVRTDCSEPTRSVQGSTVLPLRGNLRVISPMDFMRPDTFVVLCLFSTMAGGHGRRYLSEALQQEWEAP